MKEIIYGIHVVRILLERAPERFLEIFFLKERKDNRLFSLINKSKKIGISIQIKDRYFLDKKVNNAVHQGVVAFIYSKKEYIENDLPILLKKQKNPLILVLDSITDPHNLGACLRCADAVGVHIIIIPKNRSVYLNSTVRKVASGAADNIPIIRVTNLVRTFCKFLQNILIVGAIKKSSHNIYQSKLTGPLALVIGSEDIGIRNLTRKYCNNFISIPMMGSVSSLNVSVATAVCLFEILRQRNL